MIDSLSPFQVPRRSGIALCCAAAGAAVSVASTAIQASFDMVEFLQGLIASLFPVQSPHRNQRGNGREQEEPGKNPSLNIPLQKTGEIIDVGAERKCKAVDIRFAFACRQNRHDRNCSFENYRGNEHRDRTLADDVGTFHKIGSMSATPPPRVCNLGEASPTCSLGSAEDRLYPLRTASVVDLKFLRICSEFAYELQIQNPHESHKFARVTSLLASL